MRPPPHDAAFEVQSTRHRPGPVAAVQNEPEAQPVPLEHGRLQKPSRQIAPRPAGPQPRPSCKQTAPSASGGGTQCGLPSANGPEQVKPAWQAGLAVTQSARQTPSGVALHDWPVGQLVETPPLHLARQLPPAQTEDVPSGPQRALSTRHAVSSPWPLARQAFLFPYQRLAQEVPALQVTPASHPLRQ